MVVNDSHSAGETELQGAMSNLQRILGIFTPLPSTELIFTWNTAHSDSISRRPSSVFKLFLDTSSGTGVIDADLQVLQPRFVQRSMRSLSGKSRS